MNIVLNEQTDDKSSASKVKDAHMFQQLKSQIMPLTEETFETKPIYGFNYQIPYAFPKRSIPKKKDSLGRNHYKNWQNSEADLF